MSDTGIGIPATEMPYLFAKFSRGKDIGRLNVAGTGLGLYVAKTSLKRTMGASGRKARAMARVRDLSKYGRISPQLCWGDEWPNPLPWGERVRVRGK